MNKNSFVFLRANRKFIESVPTYSTNPLTGQPMAVGKEQFRMALGEIRKLPRARAEHLMREYNAPAGKTRIPGKQLNVWFELVDPGTISEKAVADSKNAETPEVKTGQGALAGHGIAKEKQPMPDEVEKKDGEVISQTISDPDFEDDPPPEDPDFDDDPKGKGSKKK